MNTAEFFRQFEAETRRRKPVWFLSSGVGPTSRIRTMSGTRKCHCPLSFMVGTTPGLVMPAAKRLRMQKAVALRLAYAADHDDGSAIRARLLKACGLEAQ